MIKVFSRVESEESDWETVVLGTPIWIAEYAV